ncbi:uncharacterized protein BDR25DRAFT_395911 [Lindgomyces ingoldianus]|uniref:Uncharacterized protein n=1 Tax=Lindgomyces ingoldianus TaxID=673940 RepID=A0ACB6QGT3_9PLEO|nr:uncharacterized protein BDR25DRAFT_395911 [Lindgomyces ingoldianus]KAF2466091.1 hypothetical protein BDR25DRAFT_395911 [Lindgomyces ingoldianus]
MANSLASGLHDLHLNPENNIPADVESPLLALDQDSETRSTELKATITNLIQRCKTLYSEVQTYITAVDANQKLAKNHNPVEYRSLRNDFKNELSFLTKLVDAKLPEEKAQHYIVSSNLVYYEALWDAAKRSLGLLSFRKYFFWNRRQEDHGAAYTGLSLGKGSQVKGKNAALVDIVAGDGMEWIRVSTISEKRLLFDLAKLGWQNDSDDDDEDMPDAPASSWEDGDDEDQVDIVKSARELARAARANPICGRPPKVRFVLTRISSRKLKEVDTVLDKIRATGAIVECANELSAPPLLSTVLPNLLVDRSRILSQVLNIDCTILLALISDISHSECPVLDWYPTEVRAQIKEEAAEKLLPTHLYPAIGSHPMVCTQEAADQMNLIVDTLATDTEKTRANLLLAQNDRVSSSPASLLQGWALISDHPVPKMLQLPIKVVPSNLPALTPRLPKVAQKIGKELSPLNQAIFFYGWAEGLTTLSSNRTRARQIEHAINEEGLEDGEAGPHIWLCGEIVIGVSGMLAELPMIVRDKSHTLCYFLGISLGSAGVVEESRNRRIGLSLILMIFGTSDSAPGMAMESEYGFVEEKDRTWLEYRGKHHVKQGHP